MTPVTDPRVTDLMPRLGKYSSALYLLWQAGFLADDEFKPAVGTLIRQATETRLFHLTTDYRSRDAEEALANQNLSTPAQYHRWCVKHLRHEHIVPTSVVLQVLRAIPDLSANTIADVLLRYRYRATITPAEDKKLRECGLTQKMPPDFWEPTSALYDDPCARYVVAGLNLGLVPRTGATWL